MRDRECEIRCGGQRCLLLQEVAKRELAAYPGPAVGAPLLRGRNCNQRETLVRCVEIRSSKYLNNVVEQDHRRIKQRVRAMLGFKRLETAAITITGIELAEKIRKQQFKIGNLPGRPVSVPGIWAAVLAG
jgi:hypothetical protein